MSGLFGTISGFIKEKMVRGRPPILVGFINLVSNACITSIYALILESGLTYDTNPRTGLFGWLDYNHIWTN